MPSGTTSFELPRVVIVDDNAEMLARATTVLASGCTVVDQVSDGAAALDADRLLAPDAIVLDISMPGMNGFTVAERLRRNGSKAAIVFLTVHDDPEFLAAARAVGALGYVLKSRLSSDLLTAVREARAGRPFVSTCR